MFTKIEFDLLVSLPEISVQRDGERARFLPDSSGLVSCSEAYSS
jgi:hypothetical protein